MRLRNLTILWVVLSLAVGLCAYAITGEHYSHSFHIPFMQESFTVSLPIAVWVVLPLSIFFFIVCLALFCTKVKAFLEKRRSQEDSEFLINQIVAQVFGEDFSHTFKIKNLNEISKSLARFNITPNIQSMPSGVEKIDQVVQVYKSLLEGEVTDLRRFRVSEDSALLFIEKRNKMAKDANYASEILKKDTEPLNLKREAFLALLQYDNTAEQIHKYLHIVEMDKEIAKAYLNAVLAQRISFIKEEVIMTITKAEFTDKRTIKWVLECKKILSPDQWLNFAEELANRYEVAEEAYLYVLANLEMIHNLKERLKLHTEHEFLRMRAFADLRDEGKNYPLEAFYS
ncbi:hypothetical protein CCZ01_02000 [Helicobacter monodelphidis]|uniref:hypothetical protein n=1 Tax=Helicobacter sp. 15-1451 TaxID=2004995 RepID=UPI000DCCEAE6|nr:hypothetical protein [Helicobacter sp. 15-1451]RAX58580.1 hypothetical protein CCZ01_02000 [Helicobacter sp. 15-1451]